MGKITLGRKKSYEKNTKKHFCFPKTESRTHGIFKVNDTYISRSNAKYMSHNWVILWFFGFHRKQNVPSTGKKGERGEKKTKFHPGTVALCEINIFQ